MFPNALLASAGQLHSHLSLEDVPSLRVKGCYRVLYAHPFCLLVRRTRCASVYGWVLMSGNPSRLLHPVPILAATGSTYTHPHSLTSSQLSNMTGGVESTLHQDASSTSSSAAAQAALSHADVEASLHALKAKVSTAISKHCASLKAVHNPKEQYTVTNDMSSVVRQTLTGFWAADPLTDRETDATGSVSSATDTVGAARAGSAPRDFSLNRIASDHATYLVGQALDKLLSEVQAATTQINQKCLQAKCDSSIGRALNRFHRESHRFAEVPAYSGTAGGYGSNIFTCQDMLSDEEALRSAARNRYFSLSETGVKVGTELIYRWSGEPGSAMTCLDKASIPEDEAPEPVARCMTPDSLLAEDEPRDKADQDRYNVREQSLPQKSDEDFLRKAARGFSAI